MSNKPVDLVVSTKMHEAVAALADAERIIRMIGDRTDIPTIMDLQGGREMLARSLLCKISHECGIEIVLAALAAVKAPATLADIAEGMQAVRDRQAQVAT